MIIRRKKLVVILLVIAVVLLSSMSVMYAALSTSLTVTTNKITQNAMSWNIGFVEGTITGSSMTSGGHEDCGTATATATTITGVTPTLSGIGEGCSYPFTIRNNGTIGGKISSITITKPTDTTCTISGSTMVCGKITYKLHYNSATSTSLVANNDTIAAKSGSTPTIRILR